ncbi:MAG TPA: hypothetical protein DCR97_07960 [Deltaproteobacteria bacterium]|nr:hypothetical protein [Deltaproteobacteria bacterium]
MRADGRRDHETPLRFAWDDRDEEVSPFADSLFALPGVDDAIIYGRHAGNSTAGDAQRFYRVGLKGGDPTVVVRGRDLVWSADHRSFLTGDGRRLARLDRKRMMWVSPLSLVSLRSGKARPLVRGIVSVGGFDWRPSYGRAY